MLQKGSPAVNVANGEFTIIRQVTTNTHPTTGVRSTQTAELERPLEADESTIKILVVAEEYGDDQDNLKLTPFSPAMVTMVSRFGLVQLGEPKLDEEELNEE